MSASTVSITANPAAAARRRPVVLNERKQNLELVNDVTVTPNVDARGGAAGGGDGDDTSAGSKNLSHSIRGEAISERSRDMVQLKKNQLPNSTVSPRRVRKSSAPKPEKPMWKTVLSIFTKNLCLLLVLIGLVQMVRKLVISSRIDGSGSLMGFSDMEGRIAEVDLTFKKTTKMLQAQLDAFDGKIKGEVGSLRKVVNEKISKFASGLGKLGERSDNLENALSELSSKEFLTQEDLVTFSDELKKAMAGGTGGGSLSWDDIRAFAREIVLKEIDKHAADGLGRVDYALASGGATVLKHSEPLVVGKGRYWFYTTHRHGVNSDAEKMLEPSFGEPGQCFPLKGSSGFVQIKLRTAIIPEAITLEHVAKSVAYDRSSAPKDCLVSGWLQGRQGLGTEAGIENEKVYLLAKFTYDLEKSNAQTYDVFDSASSTVVDTIRLDFASNHGSQSHTCIYRLRVHGREPKSVSVLTGQY